MSIILVHKGPITIFFVHKTFFIHKQPFLMEKKELNHHTDYISDNLFEKKILAMICN